MTLHLRPVQRLSPGLRLQADKEDGEAAGMQAVRHMLDTSFKELPAQQASSISKQSDTARAHPAEQQQAALSTPAPKLQTTQQRQPGQPSLQPQAAEQLAAQLPAGNDVAIKHAEHTAPAAEPAQRFLAAVSNGPPAAGTQAPKTPATTPASKVSCQLQLVLCESACSDGCCMRRRSATQEPLSSPLQPRPL